MLDLNKSSSEIVEKKLIKMVIGGEYSPGNTLPSERDLAIKFKVSRPTLREAIQRLKRDGWITAKKGQTSIVNNFWKNGNLNTLVNIIQNNENITGDFTIYLLELRLALVPVFVSEAVSKFPEKVVGLLSNIDILEDNSLEYAKFDWKLQKEVAELSSNPIYLLILNSFDNIYISLANEYFLKDENRNSSLIFYKELLRSAMKEDVLLSEKITIDAMKKSIALWKKSEGDN